MKSEKLYDAFNYIDDWYLDIVDAPAKEANEMKHYTFRRVITVAIAAAICVSILAVTAMAAGWIPNIFASVKANTPEEQEILDAAVQVTQAQDPEVVSVPEIDFTQFTLFERYYDGESILLGYDLTKTMPEPIVGIQPEAELMARITDMREFEHTVSPGQTDDTLKLRVSLGMMTPEERDYLLENRTEYGKKYDLQKYWQIYMDGYMKETLSPEQYEQFWNILTETGSCCIAIPAKPWVGDHVLVNGHDCFEVLGSDCWSYRRDYTTDQGDCILLDPLPEAGRNQESVTVELELRSGWDYWYMELEGDVYTAFESNPIHQATFTLENVNN